MSQPPGVPGSADAPVIDSSDPREPLKFTLQIVSPSVGVASPLSFAHLPATTTVKQLKAKIRDALPSKPADESQRLIHRGRMLGRENETMLDVFGQEAVCWFPVGCYRQVLTILCLSLQIPNPKLYIWFYDLQL